MPIDYNPLISYPELGVSIGGSIQYVNKASVDPYVYHDGGPQNFADYQALLDNVASIPIQDFLLTYNANTKPLPSDITQFVKDFVTSQGSMVTIAGVDVPDPEVVDEILTGFLIAFQQNISGSVTPSGTWSELASVINLNGDITDPNQFSQLEAAFKDFVGRYPYALNGSVAAATASSDYAVNGFFKKWRDFTAINSVISAGGAPSAAPELLEGFNVPTYEMIFNSFLPAPYRTTSPGGGVDPSSPTDQTYFAEFLQQFYGGEVQRYGYFTPSHSLTNWIGYVQDLAGVTVSPTTRVPVTKTKIINNMLLLLISMIASIQNIAAAQADRLALYSSWQRGYTSILGQVHVFTASSKDRLALFDGIEDAEKEARNTAREEVQTKFNAAAIQRLTSQKDVVTDDAKALQSRVNASSDAFNEQANIATALLQELSTILATILK